MKNMSDFMSLCLSQASLAHPLCLPNPAVGAIIVGVDGEIAGIGHTQRRGGPHAEIVALQDARARGRDVRGATVFVSLEPCSHSGHTGPCTDALIAAGIGMLVASTKDPNPLVSGAGFEKLRSAGIPVESGEGEAASREINIGFFSRMIRNKPWIRMKIAASLDGKTALNNGESQWITSETARTDGQAWRRRSSAILTGVGTILKDDPRMDVRQPNSIYQPKLVIVDSQLKTPPNARIFEACREVYIYTTVGNKEREAALLHKGVKVVRLPERVERTAERVDLSALVRDLARLEINELHVEAGPTLNGALIQAGLVDEFLVYLAPKLLGPGLPMAHMQSLSTLSGAPRLEYRSIDRIGEDLRLIARVSGHDKFLSTLKAEED